MHDFQLFDKERLDAIADLERTLASKREESMRTIRDLRLKAREAQTMSGQSPAEMLALADQMEKQLEEFKLSEEDQAEKKRLLEAGFPDWSRKDYKYSVPGLS